MQDSNLRDARAPTTVFGTAALPGSANPPLWIFVEKHSRGGRADRTRAGLSPGPRVSNPVPSPLGQPSPFARRPARCPCPRQESNLHVRTGHAILNRGCLPFSPRGPPFLFSCAPGPGLEPGSAEPKSAMLPLHQPGPTCEPRPGLRRMPASRTRCFLIPNQVGCRLPRIRGELPIGGGGRSRTATARRRPNYSRMGSPHAQTHQEKNYGQH